MSLFERPLGPSAACAVIRFNEAIGETMVTVLGCVDYVTAVSAIASPRSMMAKPSANSAFVMQSGGFVKK